MTGKEIVEAFCHYQGYGEWTMNQKELILAIDDEIAKLNQEIKKLRKVISELNKAYEGYDF